MSGAGLADTFARILEASVAWRIAVQPDARKIETLTRELLLALGENPDREGLKGTPRRVADAMAFLTSNAIIITNTFAAVGG